uniref:Uncharacterized protein n=1 Tax=Nelumbo nucifera TaxID=4432 RepID=A0A822XCT6_NELNU|nr:TPA_asm: hypothetical protein HUJ06_020707 [Nelumbo nucifera]
MIWNCKVNKIYYLVLLINVLAQSHNRVLSMLCGHSSLYDTEKIQNGLLENVI